MPSLCPAWSRRSMVTLLAVWMASFASTAHAQIYAWRDANGTLVLSDHKADPAAETFAVPGAETVAATRAVPVTAADRYDALIARHAQEQRVRTDLVRAVIQVESAFNPRAVSPKGALGLMQLMPATASAFGVTDAFNPQQNIRAGVAYLKRLLTRFDGREELALAAYNAGPEAVVRHGRTIPPYRETREYVRKIRQVGGAPVKPPERIYKSVDTVGDRQVPFYSNTKPQEPALEVIQARR